MTSANGGDDGADPAAPKTAMAIPLSVATEPGQVAGRPDPSIVEFRVVTSEGVRYALKLERIFWSLLEAAASTERQRLGGYIAKVLGKGGPTKNKTSLLRTHSAEWMRRKLVEVSANSLSRKALSGVVLAAPTPCFVVTPTNAIEMQNAAFLEMLNARVAGDAIGSATIRINFHSDLSSLHKKFDERPVHFLTDQVIIHVGSERSRHEARLVAVDHAGGRSRGFLVFLMT